MRRSPVTLRGSRIRLRPLSTRDAESLEVILRDPRATRFLPPQVRRETGRAFVARVLRQVARGDGDAFAILKDPGEKVVGQIRFFNTLPEERRAEVGYWLDRRHWGQGLATEALQTLVRWGFEVRGLHRVEATVMAGNLASRRVLEKAGFRWEGRRRSAALSSGRWRDEWLFGRLSDDRPRARRTRGPTGKGAHRKGRAPRPAR